MDPSEIILLDGAMGTMLQAAGLPLGQLPELWNLLRPEIVTAVQRRYVEAGSRVLYTNTFGANRRKLAGCGHGVAEIVAAGVRCARAAAQGFDVKVALDIGPDSCSSLWETFASTRPTGSSARSSPPAKRPAPTSSSSKR